MSTTSRLYSTVGLLVLICAAMGVARRGYSYRVADPAISLNQCPVSIENYEIIPSPISEDESQVLHASDSTGFELTDSLGRRTLIHLATWTDVDEVAETCPHHPNNCYSGNGWMLLDTKRTQLEVDEVGSVPIEISSFARGEQRIVIAFTYQMGNKFFCRDSDARLAQAALWGNPVWPPVTKFLVQTPDSNIEAAIESIENVMTPYIRWHASAS